MVFQLPLNEFPEGSPPGTMGTYDPARAYLHSKTLRWSFGAMKGRFGDSWQKYAVDRPTPETLRTIALAGFSGVWVDRDGYADRGAAVEAKLAKASRRGADRQPRRPVRLLRPDALRRARSAASSAPSAGPPSRPRRCGRCS